jgi:hypothetical protein
MKAPCLTIFILLTCFWQLEAQQQDSIPFGKVKMQTGTYELGRQGISEIQLKSGSPSQFLSTQPQGKENFSESVWTLLTGLSTSTLIESAWIYPNEIHLGERSRLALPLIVNGSYEKTRERVKTADGSTLEHTEQFTLLLDEGALGWIIDQRDTLGSYRVIKRSEDSLASLWSSCFNDDLKWLRVRLRKYGAIETPTDFLIEAKINDRQFLVVYSGQYFRAVVLSDGRAVATWQDTPYAIMLSKKYRINPYLLIPSGSADQDFMEFITLLGLAHSISRNLIGI